MHWWRYSHQVHQGNNFNCSTLTIVHCSECWATRQVVSLRTFSLQKIISAEVRNWTSAICRLLQQFTHACAWFHSGRNAYESLEFHCSLAAATTGASVLNVRMQQLFMWQIIDHRTGHKKQNNSQDYYDVYRSSLFMSKFNKYLKTSFPSNVCLQDGTDAWYALFEIQLHCKMNV